MAESAGHRPRCTTEAAAMITLQDAKSRGLREHGTLNPQPQRITDVLFRDHDFFDPRDLVQVKYEMLRCVRVDGLSVLQAARRFGCSRSAFYQARAAFRGQGLLGLVPRRPGPRRAHKPSDEVVTFLLRCRHDDPTQPASALAELVQRHYGLTVHPRSIERALQRRKRGRST
jgi:transposase